MAEITILALDPSTEVTGAVVNTYDETGVLLSCQKFSFDAYSAVPREWRGSSLNARLYRIALTRHALAKWVATLSTPLDLVAYEMDTQRGFASSEALKMAAGNYLCVRGVLTVPCIAVSRMQACLATNSYTVYRQPKGKTTAEIEAKKLRLKQAVLAWVNTNYDLSLTTDEDAIADACAVAQYAIIDALKKRKAEADKAAEKAKFKETTRQAAAAKRKKKAGP